jgi:hypothetical protein
MGVLCWNGDKPCILGDSSDRRDPDAFQTGLSGPGHSPPEFDTNRYKSLICLKWQP